jgi:hypothetical protein
MKGKKRRAIIRKVVAQAIELTWSSLRSHLSDSVRTSKKHGGNERWHAGCSEEYAFTILALARANHELTRIDFKQEFTSEDSPI